MIPLTNEPTNRAGEIRAYFRFFCNYEIIIPNACFMLPNTVSVCTQTHACVWMHKGNWSIWVSNTGETEEMGNTGEESLHNIAV